MTEKKIVLAEILNPEVYTGVIERDFHLYSSSSSYRKNPKYVHIESESEPKCTCQMYDSKYGLEIRDRCAHILFVLKEVLNLNIGKEKLIYSAEELNRAFDQAEKEVQDLHQRTKEGIQTARLNGKQIGQKRGNTLTIKKAAPAKEIILKHSKAFNGTLSDIECIKLTGLSRNTYYKYKRELKAEGDD